MELFLIHGAYKLPKIGVRNDSCCPSCGAEGAHIMHMMWDCPSIEKFRRDVLHLIHKVYEISLPPQPKLCVLGLIGYVVCPRPKFLGVSRMLFQARKLLVFHWIQPSPPSIGEYKTRLNHILRLEEGVKKKGMHPTNLTAYGDPGWTLWAFPRVICSKTACSHYKGIHR